MFTKQTDLDGGGMTVLKSFQPFLTTIIFDGQVFSNTSRVVKTICSPFGRPNLKFINDEKCLRKNTHSVNQGLHEYILNSTRKQLFNKLFGHM